MSFYTKDKNTDLPSRMNLAKHGNKLFGSTINHELYKLNGIKYTCIWCSRPTADSPQLAHWLIFKTNDTENNYRKDPL